MGIILGIVVGLLMLMLLVTGHEFGHFIMARRNGVEVEEFGICFPPRAMAWRKVNGKWRRLKKTEWKDAPGEGLIISLNWLPIGGFCQMKGESAADKRKGSFGKAGFWQKTKILFGGVAVNWLIAFVVLTILAWVGMPQMLQNQFQVKSDSEILVKEPVTIGSLVDNGAAKEAGLEVGDVVLNAMNDASCEGCEQDRVTIYTPTDLMDFNERHRGETVYYTVEGKGGTQTMSVKLSAAGEEYALGAGLSGSAYYRSTWSAPIVGAGLTIQMTGETFKGIGTLIYNLFDGVISQFNTNEDVREEGKEALEMAGDSVSGPVGIIGVLFPSFLSMGIESLMFLVAIISISLACMNVLPIPALDGGRWLLIAIYKLRKKELTKETEEKIVSKAFTAILILALVVTVLDVMRLVR